MNDFCIFLKTRLTLSKNNNLLSIFSVGQIAQLVEQRTENPCVRSSILRLATILQKLYDRISRVMNHILSYHVTKC